MGFEKKIVRVEKEDGVCARKAYKCRHEGKYEPVKVDLQIKGIYRLLKSFQETCLFK
jgi:hypothetical protein